MNTREKMTLAFRELIWPRIWPLTGNLTRSYLAAWALYLAFYMCHSLNFGRKTGLIFERPCACEKLQKNQKLQKIIKRDNDSNLVIL